MMSRSTRTEGKRRGPDTQQLIYVHIKPKKEVESSSESYDDSSPSRLDGDSSDKDSPGSDDDTAVAARQSLL